MNIEAQGHIEKITKEDIHVPEIEPGGSAIVFQRHEKYDRTRDSETAGSIFPEAAEDTYDRDKAFFEELLADGGEDTMVMVVSSDTQYAGKGYRSLETAQLAQDAAVEVMTDMGLDPAEHIINLSPDFTTETHEPTGQDITIMPLVVEPKMFDETPEFVDYLRDAYGEADTQPVVNDQGETEMRRIGLSPKAFGMFEMDHPDIKEKREEMGAEGVYDIVDRTKLAVRVLSAHAESFHRNHPGKKLVVWMASHYDTISPLVKDATGNSFEEFVPVDYGAGVIIELPPKDENGERQALLSTQKRERIALNIGSKATRSHESAVAEVARRRATRQEATNE